MAYLSLQEAARALKLSQKALRAHIASQAISAEREAGVFRIPRREIQRLRRQGIPPGPAPKGERPPETGEPTPGTWVNIGRRWKRSGRKAPLSFVDLFCGAGGLTKGLEMAGLRPVCGVDSFDAAVATHRRNFSHPVVHGDVRDESVKKLVLDAVNEACGEEGLDIVAGGFPCQGFSLSGYRVVHDPRNNLYLELLDVVRRTRPRFVIAENVVGIRSMLGGRVEASIVQDLAELGYETSVEVLLAADYHVPQVRRRVFFVANRLGLTNPYPQPLLQPREYITTREAIGDLVRRGDDKAWNHVATKHSSDMAARLKAVPEGESLYSGYSDAWKKCPWDEPSCTIKENHGGVNIHPRLPRVLTAREMARLQSFPDEFLLEGTKSKQLVQIGNAVPPLLGKAVGLALRSAYVRSAP